jgi:hypothetical protein
VRLARSARVRAYVARTWDFVPKVSDTRRCIALRPCARLGACVRARLAGGRRACRRQISLGLSRQGSDAQEGGREAAREAASANGGREGFFHREWTAQVVGSDGRLCAPQPHFMEVYVQVWFRPLRRGWVV